MTTTEPVRVAVIGGGANSEHEVGLASAASVASALDPTRYAVVRLTIDRDGGWRSAGLPMPGVEIRIVDIHTRQPLPSGEVGEVETRSIANMVGYWNRDDATAQTVAADGWLRTGDAGYLDEDGYLFVVDRLKDMIITGGENVYSQEVENVISSHPAVLACAVVGLPHEKWGEAVHAVVVPRPGHEMEGAAITDWCRARLASA